MTFFLIIILKIPLIPIMTCVKLLFYFFHFNWKYYQLNNIWLFIKANIADYSQDDQPNQT